MNLSRIFIQRPIGTVLLSFGLAIAGILSFNLLPVAPLPQVDFPTIMVQASLPGASPETMATSVATPIERQLGRISGVTELTSASMQGQTSVIAQFDLSRNIDGAARDVQAAINASLSQLPSNLPSNPVYRKVNPADAPIMILSLTSDKFTTGQLYDVASTILQQRILRIEGIGQVNIGGSSLPAVRIELNPTALNHYGIDVTQASEAIVKANTLTAIGEVINKDTTKAFLKNNSQLEKASAYAPLIISYHNNAPVRLSDVATVVDSVADIHTAGFANGKPAVLLVLFKQPGANVIKTVDYVKSIMPELKVLIPSAVHLDVLLDRTTSIRSSLHEVEKTLVIAMLLVVFVTYLFLGNIRATLIPGIAVPLSLLGTFVVMRLLDYSLDNLSLMALTISTGFVVDDAVVVLENISRHRAMGKSAYHAAIDGAKEIGFTIVSISVSLIAVFIPILLMGGIVGRLFHEFVVTLSVAVVVSMLVSISLSPMMCSKILDNVADKPNQFMRLIERLRAYYAKSLAHALTHANWVLFITGLTMMATVLLLFYIPKGFFPFQQSERIVASLKADQNSSFQTMKKKLSECVVAIKSDEAVQNVAAFIGGGGPSGNTANSGTIFILLKTLDTASPNTDAVMARLRQKLAKIAGAGLYMQVSQDLSIGGRRSDAQFQYTVTAANLNDLNKWTPKIMEQIAKIPGVSDVNNDQLSHGLELYVDVDHDKALSLGLSSGAIDKVLYGSFGQNQISTIYRPMNQYKVVMEIAPQYSMFPSVLNDVYLSSKDNTPIPLSTIANFKENFTLLSVNHQSQAPAATISFNLLPGVSLGDVVSKVGAIVKQMELPSSVRGSFQGTAKEFQRSFANELYLIGAAVLAVYIVLGILYESLLHPITILSTLPSASVGALLALLLCRTELTVIAFIGIILLIGIVKKNAIMMIDFALDCERNAKKPAKEAIYEACLLRFRPILMTTMAAMLGALPLIVNFGAGSELRRPLGIAVVGGLIVSQLLTLYTTPVIYLELLRLRRALKAWLLKIWPSQNAWGYR